MRRKQLRGMRPTFMNPTISRGRDATSYRIALTANDIAKLKELGLYVNGYYVIVTKVNILRKVYQLEETTTEESQ